jgi:hypothetical protein
MQDTTPEAKQIQIEGYRRMGAQRRIEIALDLSETVRELAKVRIRKQHPDFDEQAVHDQLMWELYGFRRNR